MPAPDNGRLELLQGTLDMLILKTLLFGPGARPRDRDVHPARPQATRSSSSTGRSTRPLHRLQRDGFIAAKWEKAPDRNGS